MVDMGYLKLLVDFERIQEYWTNILKDFPGHPAETSTTTSVPLTLYGNFTQTGWDDLSANVYIYPSLEKHRGFIYRHMRK